MLACFLCFSIILHEPSHPFPYSLIYLTWNICYYLIRYALSSNIHTCSQNIQTHNLVHLLYLDPKVVYLVFAIEREGVFL